jgi:hypothetical protein
MQANPIYLSGLLFVDTNTSRSSMFFAKRYYTADVEIKSLTLVLQKLDMEQPHPSGTSRLASFHEYLHELEKERSFTGYWANHHYYRDVVMTELRRKFSISDNISETSSSSGSSFISDTSSTSSIVSLLG